MNKVTFPLKKNDKGFSVVNLLDALLVMLDRKIITPVNASQLLAWKTGLASERAGQTFGTTTVTIVKKIQQDQNFRPDGIVGSQTAAAINKLLTEYDLLEQPQEPETQAYKVHGQVKQADGSPLVGVLVRAFDKDLRHEQQLGEVHTDRQGYYTIAYSQTQFRRAEKQQADLVVRIYNAEGSMLAESEIIFNAQAEEIVNLVISRMESEISEYERLIAEISPLLEGVKIDQLTPEDIIFLSGETGLESSLIANLVSAGKLADSTSLPESFHYGLIRESLPVDLNALFQQGRQAQQRALDAAVKNKRIPELSSDKQDELLDRLYDLFVESMLDDSEGTTKSTIGRILGSTLLPLSREQKKAFLKLHLEAEPKKDLWEVLKQRPEFRQAGLVDELKVTVQIGNLTQNHVPLIRSVQKMRQDGRLKTFRELARLTVEEWGHMIKKSGEEQEPVVPPNIAGDTDAEKIDSYARQISERLENLFPTLSIAYRVKQGDLPDKETLSVFLNRSVINREDLNSDIPEFDFANTHIDRYLDDYSGTVLTGNIDRKTLSLKLKTMQRLFRVTPYYGELRALLLDGLHSAQGIVRMGAQQFVKRFAGHLSGETRATELYDKAEHQNAMATALLVSYSPAFHGVTPAVVPSAPQPSDSDLAIIPDWPSLFGSLDFCSCEHCQSVYSPSAYLVDVLHFLKSCPDKTGNKTAKDVLFQRRPDIGEIELSCANTNTPVPYIDLVNEILEDAVYPSNVIPQTRDSAEEISANPEYLNSQAYKIVSREVFPWNLPFDLWAEECRAYLQQLGAARYEIMEVFSEYPRNKTLADEGIAREYLRLNSREWNIVTGFDHSMMPIPIPIQPHFVWEYWGYPKSPKPSGWPGEILNVPVFLQKSGLSHAELLELLNTRIVNPDPKHRILNISPEDACQLDEMTLKTKSGIPDAELETKLNVIHRFIRLQRKLGWTMFELDQAFTALKPTDIFGATAPTSVFLVQLSHIERLRKLLKLPIVNLLSFWSNIDIVNYEEEGRRPLPSLYDKLFQNKTLIGGNEDYLKAFVLNSSLNIPATIKDYGSVLLAVLSIGQDDLDLLVNELKVPDQLSLTSLSILYRHCLLAKALRRKISELLALKDLTNIDPFDSEHTENVLLFAETFQRIREAGFSVKELNYLYWHKDDAAKPIAPTAQDLIKLSQTLLSEFGRIKETTQIDTASEDQFRMQLSAVLDEAQLNVAFEFLNGEESLLDNPENRATLHQYFGSFLPENPDYSKLLAGEKEKAIAYLSGLFMAFLRDQQCRSAVKQTLSETLNLDKLVAESLLDRQIRSQSNPTDPELSAIDDFLYLQNVGLIASYTGEDTDGNLVTITQTDPCIDFDWGKAAPAEGIETGTLQQVTWNGKLLAPSSESFTFHLDAAGNAELLIDSQTMVTKHSGDALPQSSPPISFTAGDVYTVHLTYTPSDSDTETPRIRLSWSSPSTTEAVISQNWLYPDDSFSSFTRSCILLWKAALLISRFRLTVKEIDYLSQHSTDFDGFDLNDLPMEPPTGQLDPKFFTQWERLYAFTNLRNSLPVKEAGLMDAFAMAAVDPVGLDKTKEKLAEATGWDIDELDGLTEDHLKNEIYLFKLRDQLALSHRLGVTSENLNNWRTFPSDAEVAQKQAQAQAIKNGLKSRYEDAQWLEVAKLLKNKLREQQRSAMVAYLLANPQVMKLTSLKDSNDLYDQLLIDVEMSACQMTSRIKQANSSVQLFVQRCLMGLEPEVYLDKSIANQWKWMKNYRVWEANRKVFLYPENWIEPELRDDKSPFFKEMENDLLQGEINLENVETAFRNYLEKLDNVALMDVRGMYWQLEEGVNILHVFARTRGGAPFIYYYRQWVNGAYWTPWEKVSIDIQGDHLVPVVYNRRLRLYWPIFEEKPQENVDTASENPPQLHWEIKLAWSEYKSGKWSAKKISDGFIKSDDRVESIHRTQYTKDQYFFLPVVLQPDIDALLILCFEKPELINDYTTVTKPATGGEFPQDAEWTREFLAPELKKIETAFGTFDIIGCHDTINYYGLYNFFKGPKFEFKYTTLISGNDIPDAAFVNQNRIDEWKALQQTKWWYDYSLPYLARGSSYKNEMVVEWSDRNCYEEDDLFINTALKRLTKLTPGQFSLLFLNQYSTTAKSLDSWIDYALKHGNNSIRERKALLPFHYIDDTRSFNILPKLSEYLVSVDENGRIVKAYTKTMNDVQRNSLLYKYENFYHPFCCRFISELNRHGIDGILDPPDHGSDLKRQFCHNIFFQDKYQPTDSIEEPYPVEWIDFMPGGSYSLYNWELFFHAPLMIADRLMNEQRFEDAQKWFHYIFDPTLDDDPVDVPVLFQNIQKFLEDILGLAGIDYKADATARRYWKIQPFFLNCLDQISIYKLMELIAYAKKDLDENNPARKLLEKMVDQWREDPFKPHLIARLRISAYQKTVVMKYLDNLIAWADNLFRRDTMESTSEATQLYILAAKILGPRPTEIQPRKSRPVKTYNELEPDLDAFSNALVEMENHLFSSISVKDKSLQDFSKKIKPFLELQASGWASVSATLSNPSLYFCIPHNEDMLEYWDTIGDRLFKVRHCMNIEGMVRQLPLFEPPINPALLVKAAAAGLDIGSVLQDLYAPIPAYRFQVILQKAQELCGEVKSLGAALLSALEKKDAEALSMLRTNNEIDLLKTATQIKEKQIEEAEESIAALNGSKALATARKKHYSGLLSGITNDFIGLPLNMWESAGLSLDGAEIVEYLIGMGLEPAAAVAYAAPDITAGSCGQGPCAVSSEGGSNAGQATSSSARALKDISTLTGMSARLSKSLGIFVRRKEEWELLLKLAEGEENQIQKQIDATKISKEIVEKELDHHNKQIEKAEAVQTFMQDKFTNKELYSWMTSQISGIYFQSYKLAYDLAKRAEKAFRFELGLDDSDYIQFGYWDSLNKGLLAGEKLSLDLKRLETSYLEKNRREYELTKNISLVLHDPMSLIQLKESGTCEILLPEELFDADYPGHYFRRLKNVSLTIPCVVGPYASINCTLSLLSSRIRIKATAADNYRETPENADSRFRYDFASVKSIATSHGQNDNGMFELNFRDERYLPFEGAGAISSWRIELPKDNNAFDFNTLSDVVLRINYTAREGGQLLRQAAKGSLDSLRQQLKKNANNENDAQPGLVPALRRLFSVRHEFQNEWYKFLQSNAGEQAEMRLNITSEHFPFLFRGKSIRIHCVDMFLNAKDNNSFEIGKMPAFDEGGANEKSNIKLELPNASGTSETSEAQDIWKKSAWNGSPDKINLLYISLTCKPEPWGLGEWVIRQPANINSLYKESVDDMLLVCTYTVGEDKT